MSLRARLIAGLLVLATAGLLVLAAITYAEQRSFLLDRVDQQTRSAIPAVGRALAEAGVAAPPGEQREHHGVPNESDGGGPPAGVNLPPGTYGERRDVAGRGLGHVTLSYGQKAPAAPNLPARLPTDVLLTVGSKGDSGLRYRVLDTPSPGGAGTTVVAVPLREADQTLNRLLLVEGLVIGGVLLALAALAWFVVRLGLRPLERIANTAGAIAAGDLSRRVTPATERTEVGRLGLALNAMLARLERAFAERTASEERLRRFLADASHELRTPLASIRGYAELFRTGAARDDANRDKAMRRIEEEGARMGVLVEDLLTLARLEEPREPVRLEVDLAEIADDAVADARATAPDRRIDLSADHPALIDGDPDQLRQVVANLVRNALVHTPAGTPVEVAVTREGAELVLEVRDHGPGLPVENPDQLFERFWRGEGGRRRGRGGAGLGLAIVAGIAESHGGTAEAGEAPGGAARFHVRLPARVVVEREAEA